jgi:hypothetical protein
MRLAELIFCVTISGTVPRQCLPTLPCQSVLFPGFSPFVEPEPRFFLLCGVDSFWGVFSFKRKCSWENGQILNEGRVTTKSFHELSSLLWGAGGFDLPANSGFDFRRNVSGIFSHLALQEPTLISLHSGGSFSDLQLGRGLDTHLLELCWVLLLEASARRTHRSPVRTCFPLKIALWFKNSLF